MVIKILVVDDSATDRFIIENMLSEYKVLTACDGLEAMAILEEDDEINLLILDLNMPKMNGFQVLEALRDNQRFMGVSTILLTNYDELDNEIKGLNLGAIDYIRKPIHMSSLKARIDVHAELIRTRELLKEQLDDQTFTFDMIFEQAPIGMAISFSPNPKESYQGNFRVNSMYEEITGRSREELIDLGWEKITYHDDLEEDIENYRRLLAGKIIKYSMEKRYIRPDGSLVWVYMVVAALAPMMENGLNHICIVKDISERKEIEMERKYLSEHDRITGLYNRDYLESLLIKDDGKPKGVKRALIATNLSDVQSLTSNYGFMYTQALIKKTAEDLSQHISEKRLLFHVHESWFIFYILDYLDKNELINFSDTIRKSLESIFKTDRIDGRIAILEIKQGKDELNIDQLLKRLHIASERHNSFFGKNFETSFYDEDLEALINRERDITEALTDIALSDTTNDELFLQFQPILKLKTGSISSFEALARLKTEKLGLVSPLEFIPIAEKTKLIIPLGEKIIFKALSFLKELKDLGYNQIGISINISPIQLLSQGFIKSFFRTVDELQVDYSNVSIEITESVLVSDYNKINDLLDQLKKSGMNIAIDDFGTGYSSLAREQELRVDYLKIDKYFIDKLLEGDLSNSITSDIISIAHKLGHYAIAEGVEYMKQLQYLRKHGCDKVQGYLISKPLDAREAIKFLKEDEREIFGGKSY